MFIMVSTLCCTYDSYVMCLCVYSGNGTEDIVRRYRDPSRLFFFSVHLHEKPVDPLAGGYEFFPGSGANDDVV